MQRVLLIVLGLVCMLVALPLVVGGAVAVAITAGAGPTLQGRIGEASSPGFAVVSEALGAEWDQTLATRSEVRIGVRDLTSGGPVFIGYGPTDDVDAYLAGTSYTVLSSLEESEGGRQDIEVPDGRAPAPPTEMSFWVEQSSGPGLQEIAVGSRSGNYLLVAMNADASPGLALSVHGSLELPLLRPVGFGLLAGGGLLFLLGIGLLIWGLRTASSPHAAGPGTARPSGQPPAHVAPPPPLGAAGPAPEGDSAPAHEGEENPWLRGGWDPGPVRRPGPAPTDTVPPADQQPAVREEQTAKQQLPEEAPREERSPEG